MADELKRVVVDTVIVDETNNVRKFVDFAGLDYFWGKAKAYIDGAVAAKNVAAEGDDYVTATAADNKVTVATNVVKLADIAEDATGKALADAYDVKSYVDGQVSDVLASVTASTQFLGVFDSLDAANAETPGKGDIIAISGALEGSADYDKNGKEFIYDGSNWIELGDVTAEQKRLTVLEGRTYAGDDYVSATLADNKVTVAADVKKLADVAEGDTALADAYDVKTYIDGKVGTGLGDLDYADEAETLKLVAAVSQTDGLISVTKTELTFASTADIDTMFASAE